MSERLSLIASVAVIGIVLYAAYLLKDVKQQDITQIVDAGKKLTTGVGTPAPADSQQFFVVGGIALLFGLTLWTLYKKK
jgi:hypothetical protein